MKKYVLFPNLYDFVPMKLWGYNDPLNNIDIWTIVWNNTNKYLENFSYEKRLTDKYSLITSIRGKII